MPSKEEVVEALRQVEDPELGMDIVELGLFYDAEIAGEDVKVTYTLTSMGCPAGAMIQEDLERVVRMTGRERFLERRVFGCDLRMRAEVVTEVDVVSVWLVPANDDVHVMRACSRRPEERLAAADPLVALVDVAE
jgi:hypothetical protein